MFNPASLAAFNVSNRRAGAGARPPVLRNHPLVASLDALPPTVTRGEETTPACEGCVRDDHPSTHAPREHGDAGDHQRTSREGPASFPRRSNPEEPRHGGFHPHGGQGDARRGIIPRFSMRSMCCDPQLNARESVVALGEDAGQPHNRRLAETQSLPITIGLPVFVQ